MSVPKFNYSPLRTFEAVASPKAPHDVHIDGPCVSVMTTSLNELRSVQVLRKCEAEDLRDRLNAALRALEIGAEFDSQKAENGRARPHRGPWPIRNHRTLAEVDRDAEAERFGW